MTNREIVDHVSVARALNPSEPAAQVNDAPFVAIQLLCPLLLRKDIFFLVSHFRKISNTMKSTEAHAKIQPTAGRNRISAPMMRIAALCSIWYCVETVYHCMHCALVNMQGCFPR
jgi:hypothetical protein